VQQKPKTRFTRKRPDLRHRDPIAAQKLKSAFVRLGGQKRGLPSKKGEISLEYVKLAADSSSTRTQNDAFPMCRHSMRIRSNISGEIPCKPWGLNRSRQCSAIKKSDVHPVQNFYKRVELRINLRSYTRSSSILFALVHVLLGKPRFCPPNRRVNVDFLFFLTSS
jgi:hypothetical protein